MSINSSNNSLPQTSSLLVTAASSSSTSSSSTTIDIESIDSILSKVANRILVTLPNFGSSNFTLTQYSTVSGVGVGKITRHSHPRSRSVKEIEEVVCRVVKEVREKIFTCDDFIPNSWNITLRDTPDCYNKFGSAFVRILQFQQEITLLRGVTTHIISSSSDFSFLLMARFVAITRFGRATCDEIVGAIALKCYELGLKTLLVMVDQMPVDSEINHKRRTTTPSAFPILLINVEQEVFDRINATCKGENRIYQVLSQIRSGICFDSITNEVFRLEDLNERGQNILQRVKLYGLNNIYSQLMFDPAKHMHYVSILQADAEKVYKRALDILLEIKKSDFDLNKLDASYKEQIKTSQEYIQGFLQYQKEKTKQFIKKCREIFPDLTWKKKGVTVWVEGSKAQCELVEKNLKSMGYDPSVRQIKNSSQYVCILSIESRYSSSSSTSTTFESKRN